MAALIQGATAEELLTVDWLADALQLPVAGAELQRVGTGQIGDCERVTLTYSEPCDGPTTLVAKIPSQDPTSRNAGVALGTYRKESTFYRDLRGSVSIAAPRCYYVDFDDKTCEFVLLLEDAAPAEQGNQLTGCTPDEAALAVLELPKLHAPMWGDASLDKMEWLAGSYSANPEMSGQFVGMLYVGFKERYDGRIDADIIALADRMFTKFPAMYDYGGRPNTLQHGDYRLDNMLFATPAGGPPITIVDWQTVCSGQGVADLSYFIGAGLPLEDRRKHEEDLVRQYHAAMNAAGVALDWDDLWWQYRRHTTAGLVMAIGASQVVIQTERGDDMFVAMAQGAGRHALDLDFEGTL